MIAAAAMGDPNASIPTPQPVHYRPMFGAFARTSSVTFVSQAALKSTALAELKLQKPLVAVKNTRKLGKKRHGAQRLPARRSSVDPETYEVRADGELLACEPAEGAADGAALFPILMVIVREKLASPCRRRSLEPRFEHRQKSRLRARLDNGEEVALVLPRGEVLRGGDRVHRDRRARGRDRGRAGEAAAHRGARRSRASPTTSATATCRCRSGDGFLRIAEDHVLEEMAAQARRARLARRGAVRARGRRLRPPARRDGPRRQDPRSLPATDA